MLPLRVWLKAWTPPSPTPSQSLILRCVKNYKLQSPNGLSGTPSTEWSCPLWSLRNTNTTMGDKLEFKVTGLCLEQRPAWTESWGHRAQRQVAGGARRSVSLRPDCNVGRWCRIPFCHWQILRNGGSHKAEHLYLKWNPFHCLVFYSFFFLASLEQLIFLPKIKKKKKKGLFGFPFTASAN